MEKINVFKIKLEKEKNILVETKQINSPEKASKVLFKYLEGVDREHLVVLGLNTKNNINIINTVSIGSLNSSIVHPREIFKPIILYNCSSFIIGHNHPSGDPTPSQEDINVSNRLKECGMLMGIELLDHIIIGDHEKYISLKEKYNI